MERDKAAMAAILLQMWMALLCKLKALHDDYDAEEEEEEDIARLKLAHLSLEATMAVRASLTRD